jgi:hypothetical protein
MCCAGQGREWQAGRKATDGCGGRNPARAAPEKELVVTYSSIGSNKDNKRGGTQGVGLWISVNRGRVRGGRVRGCGDDHGNAPACVSNMEFTLTLILKGVSAPLKLRHTRSRKGGTASRRQRPEAPPRHRRRRRWLTAAATAARVVHAQLCCLLLRRLQQLQFPRQPRRGLEGWKLGRSRTPLLLLPPPLARRPRET